MRRRGLLALAAYLVALTVGAALAVRRSGGPAVSALAPIGGYVAPAPPPPAWAVIRLRPAAGAGAGPMAGLSAVLRAAVQVLGGYAASADGAVEAAFPGLRLGGGAAGPPPAGAVPE